MTTVSTSDAHAGVVEARVAALKTLCILDTPPEPAFDILTRLAAYICATPIALVSLIDGKRLWFKSTFGLDATSTPSSSSFCCEAVNNKQFLEICDAQEDKDFCALGVVTGALGIRYYAGVPLVVNNVGIGTLCVLGKEPHKLTPPQIDGLNDLAVLATLLLQARIEAFKLASLARTD